MDDNKTPERPLPLVLTDTGTGKEYTLEFNRESVRFAERMGLDISALSSAPETNIPILFYASFRKNNREVTLEQSNRILYDELEGLTGDELARLTTLYTQAVDALRLTEGERKNARMTLKLR